MQYGISVPNFGNYADPRTLAELAREAEQSGWDGFFVWDHMGFMRDFREPIADPWVLLAAIAMRTERVKLGPMVTPVARRRPWVLARQCVSLDHLSNGRLIFGAGLGYPPDAEFEVFGEEGDARVRARKLDEGLEILTGLWSGEPFSYEGDYHRIDDVTFLPKPVQERIPIWIAGTWPHRAPFRRAACWDGVFPMSANAGFDESMPVGEVRAALAYITEHRPTELRDRPYDIAIAGSTSGTDRSRDAALLAPYVEAGVTWWIENINGYRGPFDAMRERIQVGPSGLA